MADKKQKRKTSAEQIKAYNMSMPETMVVVPQQLKSVYTGRDKATIENHLKFVPMCHKLNVAAVYCWGFVESCRIQHPECIQHHWSVLGKVTFKSIALQYCVTP